MIELMPILPIWNKRKSTYDPMTIVNPKNKMKKIRFSFIILFFSFVSGFVNAQDTRLNNNNTIGWYNYFGTFKISEKMGIHTEYGVSVSEK